MGRNEDGRFCDIDDIKRIAGRKRESRVRELRKAGIPITSDILSGIAKQAYKEAASECKPVELDLTEDQMELLKKYYPNGANKYKNTNNE